METGFGAVFGLAVQWGVKSRESIQMKQDKVLLRILLQ
jgi:hypothetical protein